MSRHRSVLMVLDDQGSQHPLACALRERGYAVTCPRLDGTSDLHDALHAQEWSVVLCDYDAKLFGGDEALATAATICETSASALFFADGLEAEAAADLLKAGAFDYADARNTERLIEAVERIELGMPAQFKDRRYRQMQNQFIATASHELRTPLTSVIAALGLIDAQGSAELPPAMQRMFKIALANSQRLARLVNDILDVEKIENGALEFQLMQVDARAVVATAIDDMREFADASGISLRLESCISDASVRADGERLAQALRAILSNAVKFSPRGSDVLVNVAASGPYLDISVRDFGSGVPESYRNLIFDRFSRADTTNIREQSGIGLGLSIVKEIVARHDGVLDFETGPGIGTTFHILLPYLPSPDLVATELGHTEWA